MSQESEDTTSNTGISQTPASQQLLDDIEGDYSVSALHRALELLRKLGPEYAEVARRSGLSLHDVRHMDITFLKRWQASEDGLGRYELRKYIVAVKHIDEDWETCKNWKEIELARDKYNDGTHEMFTGRDKYNLILYLKPRRIKARPRRYFGVFS